MSEVLLAIDARGVATVTLNRPATGNAYNSAMLAGLTAGLAQLAANPAVRVVVVRGAGKHFQAGADINWLGETATAAPEAACAASRATPGARTRPTAGRVRA